MQYTEHYNLNLPEGADIVNPLTNDNPNYTKIDSEMYANKMGTVQTARVSLQENTIAITRDESKPSTFKFVATMNYSPSMSFTVDGTVVTATLPDGSALAANAFRIGSIVLCAINGTALNIYTVNSVDVPSIVATVKEACYPVGSIYCNATDSSSPTTILGFGTWQQIQGSFLFGSDITHPAGSTGGEETHTLTVEEMPSHQHDNIRLTNHNVGWAANQKQSGKEYGIAYDKPNQAALYTSKAGGGLPHNNMPPYLSVYMWQRIS